jgi:hypothetical protein
MSVAAAETQQALICLRDPRDPRMAGPTVFDAGQVLADRQEPVRSDHIESKLVENRLLDGLGVFADQVNLAVRTATMVKAHDATVGR